MFSDSPQALHKHREEALDLCQVENLGPPAAMTTTVGNAHTGAIAAYVKRGRSANLIQKTHGLTSQKLAFWMELPRMLWLQSGTTADAHKCCRKPCTHQIEATDSEALL